MFKLKQFILDWCINKQNISIGSIHEETNPEQVEIFEYNEKLKFIESGKSDKFVLTPTGYSPIKTTLKTVPYQRWIVELEDGKLLSGADRHILIDKNDSEIFIKDCWNGLEIKTIDGVSKIKSIVQTQFYEQMFDLQLHDREHVYFTDGILSHNTTVVGPGYLLWFATFSEDKLCVIASRSMSHATEIMHRIKFAYEELPDWLKAGCKYYNRTSIEFDNGSVIKSEATTEKTGRGGSPSVLFVDEISWVPKRIQEEMWASLAPSLSTGGKLIMTTTPNGDTDLFANLWNAALCGRNQFKTYLALYDRHPERGPDSGYYEEMIEKLGEIRARVEIGCEFLSTESLLINSRRLSELLPVTPSFTDNGFEFWEELGNSPMYLVGVDVATGSGNDFTVVQVFSFPALEQVAEYRSNLLNIPELYSKIKWLLNMLTKSKGNMRPEVFWSFERNGVGEAVSALYHSDDNPPEYAELISDHQTKLGMATTSKTKVLACLQLKTLIEKIKKGLVIKSTIDIFELKQFVATGISYAARPGLTDDAVMALLIIVRLIEHCAKFDSSAHEIMYKYNEKDYIEGNDVDLEDYETPTAMLF